MDARGIPTCIGIILDGNRRWAKEQGLPNLEGHRRGFDNVEPIALHARDRGIKHVVVYAFSTENWNRSPEEVSYLMDIFETMSKEPLRRLTKEGIAIRFVGERERFSESLQRAMQNAEAGSPGDVRTTLWICLSYGGRADIVQAARKIAETKEAITEDSLSRSLWTAGMPDPDLIIRTGGEHRLSNFLLWQSAYSELFFERAYWPAFTPADLDRVLGEYASRERRMGK
jgi:undecaprenyl diphosphate synthase